MVEAYNGIVEVMSYIEQSWCWFCFFLCMALLCTRWHDGCDDIDVYLSFMFVCGFGHKRTYPHVECIILFLREYSV